MNIQNIVCQNIRYTPSVAPIYASNPNSNIRFKGINFKPDVCEISPATKEFNKNIDIIMSKILDKSLTFTPEKLEAVIQSAKANFQNFNEEEILRTIQRLTQWADYTCLPKLGKRYGEIQEGTPVNNCFNYFQHFKRIFPADHLQPEIMLVTERELELMPKLAEREYYFVNLEGFDAGINLFTDNDNLGKVTTNTLQKVQKFREKHPEADFNEALFMVLNGKILKTMRNLNRNVETMRIDAPPTREAILEQMQPFKAPSRDEVVDIIERTAKHFTETPEDFTTLRGYLADFYASRLEIYSKQKILDTLKQLKSKISEYLQNSYKLSEENSYLLIPKLEKQTKSYDVITEMYARQNDIPHSKLAYIENVWELNKYPPNASFILLDDMIISGNAISTMGNYHKHSYNIGKDKHILFSPITAHERGLMHLQYTIDGGRHYIDDIITLPNNVKSALKSSQDIKFENYFIDDPVGSKVYGYEGFRVKGFSGKECIILPYMTPDNNPDLASFLSHKFFPNMNPLKNVHTELYTILDKM